MFDLQNLPKIGLVFEFRLLARNGVIDQEKAQWFQRDVLAELVKSIHFHVPIVETVR